MKTPPPWIGGQIGYGETNNTLSWLGSCATSPKRSRKYPPSGLRNASVSEMTASERALWRDRIAPGSWKNARNNPPRLARSGESPKKALKVAPLKMKKKCDHKRGSS